QLAGDDLTDEERAVVERRLYDLYDQLPGIRTRPDERLVAINRQGVHALASVLPLQSVAQLERLYRESAYPSVYPDPASALPLYEAALDIADLDPGIAAQIEQLRQMYVRQHAILSSELAQAHMARRRAARHTSNAHPDALQLNSIEPILDIGLERELLNAAQIDRLRSLLPAEQVALLPEWDFAKNPVKRPWDFGNELRDRARKNEIRKFLEERARERSGGR
ncbi:MAG: hypothetical protein ACR2GY_08095, partial [Phycisphaerales bacterium]